MNNKSNTIKHYIECSNKIPHQYLYNGKTFKRKISSLLDYSLLSLYHLLRKQIHLNVN